MNINYYDDLDAVLQWDRYQHFHKTVGIFSTFSTGEVRCNHESPGPEYRGHMNQQGIEVVFTSDAPDHHTFSFDQKGERPIPKAQLNQNGGQYLVWDRASGRCVALGRCEEWGNENEARRNKEPYQPALPVHLRGAAAYTLGRGDQWVGQQQIAVNAPDKTLAVRWCEVKKPAEALARALLAIHVDALPINNTGYGESTAIDKIVGGVFDDYQTAVNVLVEKALDREEVWSASNAAYRVLRELRDGQFKPPTRSTVNVDAIYFRPA